MKKKTAADIKNEQAQLKINSCNLGDKVINKDTELFVHRILDQGCVRSKANIVCCRISPSGKALNRRLVHVLNDWRHL